MAYPLVYAPPPVPFKFGEPSTAPSFHFVAHYPVPAGAHGPATTAHTDCQWRPAQRTQYHTQVPLAAVNGPARSHPLQLGQPARARHPHHQSRPYNRPLPNLAPPVLSSLSPASPASPASSTASALPSPPALHVVCNPPLHAPKPLPYHSPTFLHFDLPDDDEDLSHPPYVSRPHKRKRTAHDEPPAAKRRAPPAPDAARWYAAQPCIPSHAHPLPI